jgi:release factor glutamine methyltransferase
MFWRRLTKPLEVAISPRADFYKTDPRLRDLRIPIQEKESMESNVVDFEPNLALFVSDEDPLIFYRVIAEQAIQLLNLGGILYFEIHENFGQMLVTLMEEIGFTNVTLKQDLQGKDRMIQAQKYYK